MVLGRQRMDPVPDATWIPPESLDRRRKSIFQSFPPPDSLTDPELAGPVQLLRSGKFDIPIERLTGVEVPRKPQQERLPLPLFKGRGVKTPSGLKPAWYIILDAGDQAEADRPWRELLRKLRNAGDAARPPCVAPTDVSLESGIVDFSPDRVVMPALRIDRSHPGSPSRARSAMRTTARW